MRFEHSPQLILTKDEFDTLDNALKLCRDMDTITNDNSCQSCPFAEGNCTCRCADCIYIQALQALKKIIDIAIVK